MPKQPDKPESSNADDVMVLFTDKGPRLEKPLSFPKILANRKRANEVLTQVNQLIDDE